MENLGSVHAIIRWKRMIMRKITQNIEKFYAMKNTIQHERGHHRSPFEILRVRRIIP